MRNPAFGIGAALVLLGIIGFFVFMIAPRNQPAPPIETVATDIPLPLPDATPLPESDEALFSTRRAVGDAERPLYATKAEAWRSAECRNPPEGYEAVPVGNDEDGWGCEFQYVGPS